MKSLVYVVLLVAFGAGHSALADGNLDLKPYSLRLELPVESAKCADRASSLGSTFATQTGLIVTSADCVGMHSIVEDGTTYETATLIIDYMASAEELPYQAIFGGTALFGTSVDHSGLFSKYSECMRIRGAQEAAFEAATGLQVFASYCDISNDEMNPGYSLVVEAFGTPKSRLYAFMQDDGFGSYSSNVMDVAVSSITQAGGTIAFRDAAHVFYYSPYGVTIDVNSLGDFSDGAQCRVQLSTAQTIYSHAAYPNDPSGNSTALCDTDNTANGATLVVVSANIQGVSGDSGVSSPVYTSFTDCMSDVSRVIQNAESNGDDVLGGICAPNEDGSSGTFVANLYSVAY